jgi:hypothetical protein
MTGSGLELPVISAGGVVRFVSRMVAIACLAGAVSSQLYAQQDESGAGDVTTQDTGTVSDEEEEEDKVRVEENIFIPSEEISQDNAVPFPVDI